MEIVRSAMREWVGFLGGADAGSAILTGWCSPSISQGLSFPLTCASRTDGASVFGLSPPSPDQKLPSSDYSNTGKLSARLLQRQTPKFFTHPRNYARQ